MLAVGSRRRQVADDGEPKGARPFGARLVSGALCGAAIGISGGALAGGLIAGVIGAVLGTLGGAKVRGLLAAALGRDLPAALIEDLVAVGAALLIVLALAS